MCSSYRLMLTRSTANKKHPEIIGKVSSYTKAGYGSYLILSLKMMLGKTITNYYIIWIFKYVLWILPDMVNHSPKTNDLMKCVASHQNCVMEFSSFQRAPPNPSLSYLNRSRCQCIIHTAVFDVNLCKINQKHFPAKVKHSINKDMWLLYSILRLDGQLNCTK